MPHVILPPGVRDLPAFRCELCGEEFTSEGALRYMGHVAACAEVHAAEIHESLPSTQDRGTIFDPETWDSDAEAYMKRVGERMLREGRLELKRGEGLK